MIIQRDQVISCSQELLWGDHAGLLKSADNYQKLDNYQKSDNWKTNNIETIKKRLSGWQLESFNESYEYKINKGMSLFKKNQIK